MTKTLKAAAFAIAAFATLSIAASGDAFARGGGGGGHGGGMGMHGGGMGHHGGSRFFGGHKFGGYHFHSRFARHDFRYRRYYSYGYGYGYSSCWRWTPDGPVNVCYDY